MKVVKSLDIINDYIEKLEQENKQLKGKIDKAIDFIDNWEKYKKDNGSLEISMLDLIYIKEILEGEENE